MIAVVMVMILILVLHGLNFSKSNLNLVLLLMVFIKNGHLIIRMLIDVIKWKYGEHIFRVLNVVNSI